MPDDMTSGEMRRTLERIEQQQREAQTTLGNRITQLAADMVPTVLWTAANKALADDVHDLEGDVREAIARIESTSQERMSTLRSEIGVVRGEAAGVRKAQEQHLKAHESDRSWSRSKTMTVIAIAVGAAATLVGAYIAAFAAAGGVR